MYFSTVRSVVSKITITLWLTKSPFSCYIIYNYFSKIIQCYLNFLPTLIIFFQLQWPSPSPQTEVSFVIMFLICSMKVYLPLPLRFPLSKSLNMCFNIGNNCPIYFVFFSQIQLFALKKERFFLMKHPTALTLEK